MAGKKRGPSKKTNGKAKRKPLAKKQVQAVKALIHRSLDHQIEDKYRLDVDYHNHVADWDNSTKTLLIDVTPSITQGDGIGNRTGNKVRMKFLRSFIKMMPSKREHQIPLLPPMAWAENPIRDIPHFRVFLLRMNRELIDNMSGAEIRVALNVKFRTAGHCWQDYAQSTGQRAQMGLKLLDKFVLKPRYRTIVASKNSQTTLQTASGADYVNTYLDSETIVMSVPQYTYKNFVCSAVAQKVEFDSGDSPIRYKYFYFVQTTDGFNDDTYNPIFVPDNFQLRNVWVYEDA